MTCGCCYRRGEDRPCNCVVNVCRRCVYCVRHCRCVGSKCIRVSIDEVLERVLEELNATDGPFADLHACFPQHTSVAQGPKT